MFLDPGLIIGGVLAAMTAGGVVGLLARTAAVFVVAQLTFAASVERPSARILRASLFVALASSAAYHLLCWLAAAIGLGVIGLVVGMLAGWYAMQWVCDRMFGLDFETSATITGRIASVSLLFWIIIGAGFLLLRR